MARNDRKRARDLAETLAWALREMSPRVTALPANPDGLEHGVAVEVAPGYRVILFPHGARWRGLMVQYEAASGQVLQTFEHQSGVETDEEAPRWAASVIRDVLVSLVTGGVAPEHTELAGERLAKVDGVIPRL
jgi:1-acyl-sn-glycerol-3-phosphate acyltransferase